MTTLQHQSLNERGHLFGICKSFSSRGGVKCILVLLCVTFNFWIVKEFLKSKQLLKKTPFSKTVIEGLKMTGLDPVERKEDENHMLQQYVPGNIPNITSPGWAGATAAQIVADSCFLKYFCSGRWLGSHHGWMTGVQPQLTGCWAARLQICVQIRSSTLC